MAARFRPAAAALGLVLAPAAAQAHAPFAGAGDFYAGLLHPLSALDYLVPLLALGLLAGQQEGERGYRAAFSCAAAGVAGACLALHGPALPWVGHATAAATVFAGLLVAVAWLPPGILFEALTGELGLGLGYLHGHELGPGTRPVPFIAGFATALVLFLVYCCGAVRHLRPAWARLGVRVAGSWLAAIAGLTLGLAFRG